MLLGVWNNVDEIDFIQLPSSFVIKTNNGSATNILIIDKSSMDEDAVRKQLNLWIKYNYGYYTAQPHYSRMKPLILAEEFHVNEETKRNGANTRTLSFIVLMKTSLYIPIEHPTLIE